MRRPLRLTVYLLVLIFGTVVLHGSKRSTATVPLGALNVRTFGAVGDGIADDEPAIQAAIDAAPIGGAVYLPTGTYRLATAAAGFPQYPDGSLILSALVVSKRLEVLGDGAAVSVLKLGAHAKMRVVTNTGSDIWWHDVAIDGNKANRDGSVSWPNGDVVDALFYATDTANTIHLSACDIGNGVEDAAGFWMTVGGTVDHCTLHDNGTPQAGAAGISFSGATQSSASSNTITRNTTGIGIAFGASGVTVSGNTITNQTQAGIAAGDLANTGQAPFNLAIQNNTVQANASVGFSGVYIDRASNSTLSGNQVTNNLSEGIHFAGTLTQPSSGWTVTGNISSDTRKRGRTQTKGIRLTGYTTATLTSNTCVNNGTSFADQVEIDSPASANADWSQVNNVSYKP